MPAKIYTDKDASLEPLKGGAPPNPFNDRGQDEDLAKFGQMVFFDKDVGEAITVAGPSGNVGDIRNAGLMCGVATTFEKPALCNLLSISMPCAGVRAPSSMPATQWQCKSMKPMAERCLDLV